MDIENTIEANSFGLLLIQYDPTLANKGRGSNEDNFERGFVKVGYFGEEDSGSKFRLTTADGNEFYFTF